MGAATTRAMVGRQEELTRLRASLAGVERTPRGVVLAGEGGIGKSLLLETFVDDVSRAGVATLAGSCLNVGEQWPFHPVRQALRRGAESADARLRATCASALHALESATGSVLEQLHDALTGFAHRTPLVLALDDFQWADSATRALVLTLLSGLTDARVLLVLAVRTDDLATDTPVATIVRELAPSTRLDIITVPALTATESAALAARAAGAPLAPVEAERLWRRSGGNPFFVESLARSPGGHALPDALRDLLLREVTQLAIQTQSVVRALSVSPVAVPHDVLLQVLGMDETAMIAAVRDGIAAGQLVVIDGDYALRHRLVGEAVGSNLLPGEKRSLHKRFAETMREVHPDRRNERALHWREAGMPDQALPELVAAAEEADRRDTPAVAWRLWRGAVEASDALDPAATSMDLLTDAARAADRAGDARSALRLLDRARPTTAQLVITRARYLAGSGQVGAAIDQLEDLISTGEMSTTERALASALCAEFLVRQGSFQDARTRAAALLPEANGPLGDSPGHAAGEHATPEGVVLAGVALGFSEAYLGNQDSGRSWLERSLREAEEAGDPALAGMVYLYLADLLAGPLNDLEEGVRIADAGSARVAELGGPSAQYASLLAAGANGLFRLGRWAEATDRVTKALRENHTGPAAADLLLSRARIVMGMGDLTAAERDLETAATLLAEEHSPQHMLPLATLRAGLAMWRRDTAAARAAVVKGLSLVGPDYEDQWRLAPLVWHGLRVEAEAVVRGESVDQRALAIIQAYRARMLQHSHGAVQDIVNGYELLCAAEASRAAAQHDPTLWEEAARFWEARTQPYPATYSRLHQAEAMFALRSRNREAAEVLRGAYHCACSMSARPLAEEIISLATRARVSLEETVAATLTVAAVTATQPVNPLSSLTSREREVLELLSEGCTNREIGERLFISERTVGVHVSRILAKLNVRSRVEASAYYLRTLTRPPRRGSDVPALS